jgi:hypothetical protein
MNKLTFASHRMDPFLHYRIFGPKVVQEIDSLEDQIQALQREKKEIIRKAIVDTFPQLKSPCPKCKGQGLTPLKDIAVIANESYFRASPCLQCMGSGDQCCKLCDRRGILVSEDTPLLQIQPCCYCNRGNVLVIPPSLS